MALVPLQSFSIYTSPSTDIAKQDREACHSDFGLLLSILPPLGVAPALSCDDTSFFSQLPTNPFGYSVCKLRYTSRTHDSILTTHSPKNGYCFEMPGNIQKKTLQVVRTAIPQK